MLHVADKAVNVAGDGPEQFLDHRAGAQVDKSQRETVQRLVAYLQRVVPVLKQAGLVDFVPNLIHVAHQFIVFFAHRVNFLVPLGQGGRLEHVNNEYRVVGGQ